MKKVTIQDLRALDKEELISKHVTALRVLQAKNAQLKAKDVIFDQCQEIAAGRIEEMRVELAQERNTICRLRKHRADAEKQSYYALVEAETYRAQLATKTLLEADTEALRTEMAKVKSVAAAETAVRSKLEGELVTAAAQLKGLRSRNEEELAAVRNLAAAELAAAAAELAAVRSSAAAELDAVRCEAAADLETARSLAAAELTAVRTAAEEELAALRRRAEDAEDELAALRSRAEEELEAADAALEAALAARDKATATSPAACSAVGLNYGCDGAAGCYGGEAGATAITPCFLYDRTAYCDDVIQAGSSSSTMLSGPNSFKLLAGEMSGCRDAAVVAAAAAATWTEEEARRMSSAGSSSSSFSASSRVLLHFAHGGVDTVSLPPPLTGRASYPPPPAPSSMPRPSLQLVCSAQSGQQLLPQRNTDGGDVFFGPGGFFYDGTGGGVFGSAGAAAGSPGERKLVKSTSWPRRQPHY